MLHVVCFWISLSIFALSILGIVLSKIRAGIHKRSVNALHILSVGVFLSAICLFIPAYAVELEGATSTPLANGLMVFLLSVHNTIRLLIVDGEFSIITAFTSVHAGALEGAYNVFASAIFVLAPVLTFGVVLSFFQNITAWRKYLFGYFKDVYVFSEINEKSLSLAYSLKANDKKRVIVFTDVFKGNDEISHERVERAKQLGAILFKDDIMNIKFKLHSKRTKMYFMIMGSDETENVNHAINLASKPYKEYKKLHKGASEHPFDGYDYKGGDKRIYLFSNNPNNELIVGSIRPEYVRVRLVNDVTVVNHKLLNENGADIFETAIANGEKILNPVTGEQDDVRLISALVVGAGAHGTEMVKSISWFGQMHPYKLQVSVIDKNEDIASHFGNICPDLIKEVKDGGPNGNFTDDGESQYKIEFFGGIDVDTDEFNKKIDEIGAVSYVFVALGEDDVNIRIAVELRALFRRKGMYPAIHAIMNNANKQKVLSSPDNKISKDYKIVTLGDINGVFSEECILQSELEEKAFVRHISWAQKEKGVRAEREEFIKSQISELKKGIVPESVTAEIKEDSDCQSDTKEITQKEFIKFLLERKGKELQKTVIDNEKWFRDQEESFWREGYNYRSSIASVIHPKYKKLCNLPGADKEPKERTEKEKDFYRRLEHRRWNAYVRSEGYVYAPIRDKLAKTHHLLVTFNQLPPKEQEKDED